MNNTSRALAALIALLGAASAKADVLTFDYQAHLGQTLAAQPDVPKDAAVTANGSLVIAGQHQHVASTLRTGLILIYPPGATQPIVRSYAPDFGGRVHGYTYDVESDGDGNFYVLASWSSNNTFQSFVLLKYTQTGTLLWQREFASNMGVEIGAHMLRVDMNGHAVVAYTGDPLFDRKTRVNIVKYMADGTLAWWNQVNDSQNDDRLLAMALDDAGNPFVLTARELGSTDVFDLTLTRFSSTGPIWWKRDLGVHRAFSFGYADLVTMWDGSAVVMARHAWDPPTTYGRMYLARFAAQDGTTMWVNWNGSDSFPVQPVRLLKASDQTLFTVAAIPRVQAGGYPTEVLLRRYTPGGSLVWTEVERIVAENHPVDAVIDPLGLIHIAGTIVQTGALQDFKFTFDGDGNVVRMAGHWTGDPVLATKIVASQNTIFRTGEAQTPGTGTGNDIYVVRTPVQ